MIVGTRGNFCTGTALARDLVLTAGALRRAGRDYKRGRARRRAPAGAQRSQRSRGIRATIRSDYCRRPRHRRRRADQARGSRCPTTSCRPRSPRPRRSRPGDRFVVAGYGATVRGNDNGAGDRARRDADRHRPARQSANPPGRSGDARQRAGLGACTGDSGAPAFVENDGRFAVIGVVSWSTGPADSDGCGGLTGVTPLALYRAWIVETARKMGSPIGP